MDISFIIPAYNAESVMERSVSSITNHTIAAEVEVIIVDDSSFCMVITTKHCEYNHK